MEVSVKAVIYCRVSSQDQAAGGYSLPAQEKSLRAYSKAKGFEIVQMFIEVQSAKKSGREQFNRMLLYFKKHPDVKTLLVETTDRLFRNFEDEVILRGYNLTVHKVKEGAIYNADSNPSIKLAHNIQTVLAQHQIDQLSTIVKRSLKEKVENGGYPRKAPFGYLNSRKKEPIVINLQQAHIVKELFELYATGKYSLQALRKEMIRRGSFSGLSKYRMSKNTIFKILRNKVYCGLVPFNGEVFKGNHEPIIDDALFDTVQAVLAGKSRPTRVNTYRYAYSGFLVCSECGHAISAEKKKNRYVYYRCTHVRHDCTASKSHVREEVLDEQFSEVLMSLTVRLGKWNAIQIKASKHFHADDKAKSKQKTKLESELDRLHFKIDQALDEKLAGNIPDESWKTLSMKWKQEGAEITEALKELEQERLPFYKDIDRMKLLLKKAPELYSKQSESEKRRLLMVLLKSKCTLEGEKAYFDVCGVSNGKQKRRDNAVDS